MRQVFDRKAATRGNSAQPMTALPELLRERVEQISFLQKHSGRSGAAQGLSTQKGLSRVGVLVGGCVIAALLSLATFSNARELSQKELAALIMMLSNSAMRAAEEELGSGEIEPEPGIDPVEFFSANLASVVSSRCVACHVGSNGVAGSGGARLLFVNRVSGQDAANVDAIAAYINLLGDDGATLLRKIRGLDAHGGGTQLPAGTQGYADFATLLEALSGPAAVNDDVPGEGFFEGVALAGPEQTLRRAALIMGGRLPTDAELQLAKTNEDGLRQAVLGLMDGPGFHEFLIRGANDRLHTEGFFNGLPFNVIDLNTARQYPVGATLFFLEPGYSDEAHQARRDFARRVDFGAIRAPLELIAHVVENNHPYTEILTADYTMVNPDIAQVYRSSTNFALSDDFRSFRPGINKGLVLRDDQHQSEYIQGSGVRILEHGPFIRYPHAGILNEPAWLNRYPSTETNRNRARARWTYLHFLGFDIEKSAPRTTDPEALADTNNPTLNNPACTACHERMDPVAGAYQNYGNSGLFRNSSGGLDALPRSYKRDDASGYQEGDTWYRDMRRPGFDGMVLPAGRVDDSLAWLAQHIVDDPRFAAATVAFWWPALLGFDALGVPEEPSDPGYDQLITAFEAQQAAIQSMSQRFRSDGFILKTLLADIVMSPWFRAKAVDQGAAGNRALELSSLGVDRLLTPEELENKTNAILGYAWDKDEDDFDGGALRDRFGIYYGGIDSVGIKERSTAMTALMANVAERQALEMSCGIVALEFYEAPEDRQLFTQIDALTTPLSEGAMSVDVALGTYTQRQDYDLRLQLEAGTRELRIQFNNNVPRNPETQQDRDLYIDSVQVWRDGARLQTIQAESFAEQPGFSQSIYNSGNPNGGVYREDVDGTRQPVGWRIPGGSGFVAISVDLPEDGDYTIRVLAWGTESGDGVEPNMTVALSGLSTSIETRGSSAIKTQIRSLYKAMLGDDLSEDDPEILAVYDLLLETWEERRSQDDNERAWRGGADEECLFPRSLLSGERSELRKDPQQMVFSWSAVMHYLMTHFDYVHE